MTAVMVAMPGNEALADQLAAALVLDRLAATVRHFPDGESHVRMEGPVQGRHALIVCTLDRPDAKLVPLFLLAHALRETGAVSVGLVAPYLPYMRQDRQFKPGETVSAVHVSGWIARHFDWLVTVDPHLHRITDLGQIYSIPTRVVHAAPAVAAWVQANVKQPLLVGPDEESLQWVRKVAHAADAPFVVLTKERRGDRDVVAGRVHDHCWGTGFNAAHPRVGTIADSGMKPLPQGELTMQSSTGERKLRELLGAAMTSMAVTLAAVATLSLSGCGYNTFQTTDEQVKAGWAEVINQYQRRADLVPNLVNTVKGEAKFEQDTLTKVIEARAKATSIQATPELINDPAAFQKFQQVQGELTGALSRLMVVSEQYPNLRANQGFRDLSTQLEGTENRITVARNRYIKAVQEYNVTVRSFPSNLTAMVFGYKEKPTFSVENEREIARPPTVGFDTAPAKPAGPASGAAK